MCKIFHTFLWMALVLLWAMDGFAQQPAVEERLIRVEEGQKALVQRVEDTNRRIDDLRADMNQRFADLRADMNQRFADLMFWLQMTFGAVLVVMGGLIAQWLVMWRRLIRVDILLADHLRETEKDRLLAFQREDIEVLKQRMERLEASRM